MEFLTERVREARERRDEDRVRLETLVEAAKQEAGARGEQMARMVVEFEAKRAAAEAGMADRVSAGGGWGWGWGVEVEVEGNEEFFLGGGRGRVV